MQYWKSEVEYYLVCFVPKDLIQGLRGMVYDSKSTTSKCSWDSGWVSESVCKTSCKKTLLRVVFCWVFEVAFTTPDGYNGLLIIFPFGISPWNSQPFPWISESLRLKFQSCYMIIGIQFLCGLKHLSFLLSADILLLMTLKGFLSFGVAWVTFFFYFIKIVVYFKQKSSSTNLLRHYNDFSCFWIYLYTELFSIAEIMMPLHSLIVAATIKGEIRKRRALGEGHTLIRRSAVNQHYQRSN